MTPVVITFAAWVMISVDLTVPAPRKVVEKPIQFSQTKPQQRHPKQTHARA